MLRPIFQVLLVTFLMLVFCGPTLAQPETLTDDPTVDLPEPNGSPEQRAPSDWVGRSKFIRSHWVRLTPNGDLTGKISLIDADGHLDGLDGLDVMLFRKGEKVAEARTDEAGNFVVNGLEPGVYALIAKGNRGFVAYGLHALASERLSSNDPIKLVQAVEIGETLSISTAAVPPTFAQLRGILSENFDRIRSNFVPPNEYANLLSDAKERNEPGSDEPEGAEVYRGTKELEKNPTAANKTRAATSVSVHQVVLEPARAGGWVMKGRLYGIDPDTGRSVEIEAGSTEVTLIQEDKRIAVDTVRAEGQFDFYGIEEGTYSLVAVGDGGFGAVAFRAVEPQPKEANAKRDHIHLVQFDSDLGAPALNGFGDPNDDGAGAGNNVGSAFPFAMALIDEPKAIQQAVARTPMGANGFAGNGIVGDSIIQPGESFGPAAESIAGMQPGAFPAANAAPMNAGGFNGGFNGGFQTGMSGGGGGGVAGGGGGLLGLAAIATAVGLSESLDDDDNRLVSPFNTP